MSTAAKCTCGYGGYCDGTREKCSNKIPQWFRSPTPLSGERWVSVEESLPDGSYQNDREEIFVIGTIGFRILWLLFDSKDNTFHIPYAGGEIKPTHWLNVRLPKVPR